MRSQADAARVLADVAREALRDVVREALRDQWRDQVRCINQLSGNLPIGLADADDCDVNAETVALEISQARIRLAEIERAMRKLDGGSDAA